MKHIVDEDLKSICDEIAAMKLSPDEWLRHDKKTFWRAFRAWSERWRGRITDPAGGAVEFFCHPRPTPVGTNQQIRRYRMQDRHLRSLAEELLQAAVADVMVGADDNSVSSLQMY